MAPIPDFCDNYHLPDGIYDCTLEEVQKRFLGTAQRCHVWKLLIGLLNRLQTLGIMPEKLLIDGSFVTGRKNPGDVDICFYVRPEQIEEAYNKLKDDHDRRGLIMMFNDDNQCAIRDLFGAHLLIAYNEESFLSWADFFRYGSGGELRDPDPQRDPKWVTKPKSKGILRVKFSKDGQGGWVNV